MTETDIKRTLIEAAKLVSNNSYSPYSQFPVGAALLDERGQIFTGTNVENASFGLTICAERSAICTAIAQGATKITHIAIYTPTPIHTSPCGACRQMINEFKEKTVIFLACDGKPEVTTGIDQLLPNDFSYRV